MALRKKAQTISADKIRSGQVLEIQYDDDTDLILVIDPNAKVVTTSPQGRANKLHAIKLKEAGLVDADLIELIKEIRSLGKNASPEQLYNRFINSKYKTSARSYRTYTPSKIEGIMRITVGQDAPGTNKIKLSNGSVLYGVVHGQHVQLRNTEEEQNTFIAELDNVGGTTFYEGLEGHEEITTELLHMLYNKSSIQAESWEPSIDTIMNKSDNAAIGNLVAGWWNQSITQDSDGGKTAINNIKSVWSKTGVSFDSTIGEAFRAATGRYYDIILDNFTSYSDRGRYSTEEFVATLSQRGFNGGVPTEALRDFNAAGHDQVFPEDNKLRPGPLKKTEQEFNLLRDEHLLNMMRTVRGMYFAGDGHIDNIKKLI